MCINLKNLYITLFMQFTLFRLFLIAFKCYQAQLFFSFSFSIDNLSQISL